VWHGRLVNRRRDGTLYHEEKTIAPITGKDGAIIGDGKTEAIIDQESLYTLYNARVSVVKVNGSLRVCVPHAITNHTRLTVKSEKDEIMFLPLNL